MSTTVTGKLNKAAREFQAGDYIGFNIRIGVRYYDRQTKDNQWTNYSCAIFAKAGKQCDFYREALTEGAIVEITSQNEKIASYDGNYYIELLDAKLGFIQAGQGAPMSQSRPQQAAQQGQQQNDDFNDDLPF